jgi:hypothetical protein
MVLAVEEREQGHERRVGDVYHKREALMHGTRSRLHVPCYLQFSCSVVFSI